MKKIIFTIIFSLMLCLGVNANENNTMNAEAYNMNVNTGSLLIEIGADSNTVEEVRYSGYLLGEVLKKVLAPQEKKNN